MIITCGICKKTYDDAERYTNCPHALLMSKVDLARKDQAVKLIGKRVKLKHEDFPIPLLIDSIDYNGMVTLYGKKGHFDPSELVVVG